jgi:hypothetical protein
MSKQSLLALGNLNLFRNTNDQIEFSLAKDNRVQAQYSSYDKTKGYDVRGIRQRSGKGVAYIKLSVAMIDSEGGREYHNGALFTNDKKQNDKQPDFQGSVSLDGKPDGLKLRLSAWKKQGQKSGDYLSISIQEFQIQQSSGPSKGGSFDLDDDMPDVVVTKKPVPTAVSASARPTPVYASKPTPAYAAKPTPVPQHASGFDDMDDMDIPF